MPPTLNRSGSNAVAPVLMTLVLSFQGLPAPFGVSSLAVATMIATMPIVVALAIVAKRNGGEARFVRHNTVLMAVFVFFAVVAEWNGGLAYPSYLISIGIHQCFFAACLLASGAEGVWRAYKAAALINVAFVTLQMIGGLIGSSDLVRLSFLGVMKGSIEYWLSLPRASGLMTEPAHLSYLLLPPLLVTLLAGREAPQEMRSGRLAMLASYVLTLSLVAYVQLGIALVIGSIRQRSFKTLAVSCVAIAALGSAYVSIPFASDRINGVLALAEGDATDQSSVFAIQSNALVTATSLGEAPLLGLGITSHRQSYERIIEFLFDFPIDDAWLGLNKDDAGSLVLLLLSEGGVAGLALFVGFVGYAVIRISRMRGAVAIIGLAHALTLAVVGLRYGQWASVHIMLNLQVVLFCLASAGPTVRPARRAAKAVSS